MQEGGALAHTFGWLVGTGPGAGFGLLILLCGAAGTIVALSGFLIRSIRDVDKLLPDHDAELPGEIGKRIRLQPVEVGPQETSTDNHKSKGIMFKSTKKEPRIKITKKTHPKNPRRPDA